MLQFDLGYSARFAAPVADLILDRLPLNLALMGVSFVIAVAVGTALGALMAATANRRPDRIPSAVSLTFYSLPNFWLGLMFVTCFAVWLRVLPAGGAGPIGAVYDRWGEEVAGRFRYLVLPAITLATGPIALYARLTRAAMLEVGAQNFICTAVSKGLSPWRVRMHHQLRNALCR